LAHRIGFDIKVIRQTILSDAILTKNQNEKIVNTTYVNNKDAMLGYMYHAAFWTATKRV